MLYQITRLGIASSKMKKIMKTLDVEILLYCAIKSKWSRALQLQQSSG